MGSHVSKLKQPSKLLNHILDQPELPSIIQNLDPGILTKLIRHVGLEDSAQIVSLATAEQLKNVLDEDLWYSEAPGREETFDAVRFGLWLEIMKENGSAFAARRVMELDEDLVTLGLCQLVLVAGIDDPSFCMSDNLRPVDGNILEKALDSSLNQRFGNYLVIAKNHSSWDAVLALMMELNELDYDKLIRLLNRCCRISGEYLEDNGGLLHVLTAGEMLEEDVSAERQERREGRGFVTPTSAAAFLRQARSTALKKMIASKTMDYGSRAYFTAAETQTEAAVGPQTSESLSGKGDSKSIELKVIRFIQTLQDAEVLPASDYKRLLGYDGDESWAHHLPLAEAMNFISQKEPALYSQRLTELSYVSNLLISGCGLKGRTFQPKEAAEAAFSVCNLGSELLIKADAESEENPPIDPWTTLLKRHHLVKLFQVGWKILFDNVVLYTAKAVLEFFYLLKNDMRDPEQAYETSHLFNRLRCCILCGRPWEFNEEMDYLQIFFDGETSMAIAELLREYPTLSEVICKQGDHRLSPFIRSQTHIRSIRRFLQGVLRYGGD
jgi:hypothetical protein